MAEDAERLQRYFERQNQNDLARAQGLIAEEARRRGLLRVDETKVTEAAYIADEGQTVEELVALNQHIIDFFVTNYPKSSVPAEPLAVAAKFNEQIGRFISDKTPIKYLLLPLASNYSIQVHLSKETRELANLVSPEVRGKYNECVFGVFRAAKDKTVSTLRLPQAELEQFAYIGPFKASFIARAFKR